MEKISVITKDFHFGKQLSENVSEYSFSIFTDVSLFIREQKKSRDYLYALVDYDYFSGAPEVEQFISEIFPCKVIFTYDSCNSVFMTHAIKCGACNFIEKNLCTSAFFQSLEYLQEESDIEKNAEELLHSDADRVQKDFFENEINLTKEEEEILSQFIGNSPEVRLLKKQMMCFAKSTHPVLITGDSGTGKSLCAKLIHKLSERNDKSFVKINCAGIPSSIAESELFGAEKGAYTDAVKHPGKFAAEGAFSP